MKLSGIFITAWQGCSWLCSSCVIWPPGSCVNEAGADVSDASAYFTPIERYFGKVL